MSSLGCGGTKPVNVCLVVPRIGWSKRELENPISEGRKLAKTGALELASEAKSVVRESTQLLSGGKAEISQSERSCVAPSSSDRSFLWGPGLLLHPKGLRPASP